MTVINLDFTPLTPSTTDRPSRASGDPPRAPGEPVPADPGASDPVTHDEVPGWHKDLPHQDLVNALLRLDLTVFQALLIAETATTRRVLGEIRDGTNFIGEMLETRG